MTLSDREMQILSLYCEGYERKDIAKILKVSERAVKMHRYHLGLKFNVSTTAQLVISALRQGIMQIDGRATRPLT